mmetsp:Transcript_22815/g.63815  ORF Transcript_22815/g.63815 Transcript_22815/m.63815 type:complete len:189 (-) Transcript_22815:37-603(-)
MTAQWGEGTSICILLRHGTPVPEAEDPACPLSEQGRAEAASTAEGVARYLEQEAVSGLSPGGGVVSIGHSGKARAEQTASAVADALGKQGWECACGRRDGLSPKDDPAVALGLAAPPGAPVVVLVGHLPHMGLLASRLLGQPAAAGRLGGLFSPASGIALRRDGEAWSEGAPIVAGTRWWEAAAPPSA